MHRLLVFLPCRCFSLLVAPILFIARLLDRYGCHRRRASQQAPERRVDRRGPCGREPFAEIRPLAELWPISVNNSPECGRGSSDIGPYRRSFGDIRPTPSDIKLILAPHLQNFGIFSVIIIVIVISVILKLLVKDLSNLGMEHVRRTPKHNVVFSIFPERD